MITYHHEEEKIVALYLAEQLNDEKAKTILLKGTTSSTDEATHLSKFFWQMVNKSAKGNIKLPCEGGSQYWTEKLYNSFGDYLENAGYKKQWNAEIDNA